MPEGGSPGRTKREVVPRRRLSRFLGYVPGVPLRGSDALAAARRSITRREDPVSAQQGSAAVRTRRGVVQRGLAGLGGAALAACGGTGEQATGAKSAEPVKL